MAGNRKNHRANHPNHRGNRHSDHSGKAEAALNIQNYVDLAKVLQETDEGFQVTWREVAFCLIGSAIFVALSVFMGIAAGMTISIHYYDDQSPVAVRRLDPRETSAMYSGSAAYRKVTTLDPTIASSNVVQNQERDGLDLGQVITTSASGQLNVLMVVDEATPLHVDRGSKSNQKATSSLISGDGKINGGKTKMIPINVEQANLLVPGYSQWKENQPNIDIRKPKILPKLCFDGFTTGFDDWRTLKEAVQEANSISAERFMKWSAYFANVGKSFSVFEDDELYYEEEVVFTICPGTTLKARKGPIYINAENVVIECHKCAISAGGTHLNFGPHARNVLVRGITFKGAQSSSLTFFYDGADASFEDCVWAGNLGTNGKFGGVADVNSTSTVNFYRCEVSQVQTTSALGSSVHPGASSLSIRS